MAAYVMGIDIGTQGTKTILFNQDMNVVASAFEASNLISTRPGELYQTAEEIMSSVEHTIAEIMWSTGVDPKDIAAIGLDGQMAGIMGVKKDGSAATYYDSWLDTRCEKYMEIMQKEGGERIIQITGAPITYTHGPKILWWKYEQPEIYKDIYKFVLPHGYVTMQMAGLSGDEAYFDYTCIQYSGFGDNLKKEWSRELLELFDVEPSKMARIVSPFEIVGKTSKESAYRCGLAAGIPLVAGLGDTAASTFGAGMTKIGQVQDCAGTASVLSSMVDTYAPDTEYKTLVQLRSPIDGLWMPMAYINGGGLCIRWFRDEFTGDPNVSYDQLQQEAEKIQPGSEGILFVPHFAGRCLPQNPYVKGSFVGLDWKHTRAHLYRAIMEGIAYEYKFYLDIIKKLNPGEKFDKIYTIGGGAKSDLFNQVKADVLGVRVTTFEMQDTALAGSAIVAGVACGLFENYDQPLAKIMKEGRSYEPDMGKHSMYAPYADQYLNVIQKLEDVYKSEVYRIGKTG